jgi:hypothetical protein
MVGRKIGKGWWEERKGREEREDKGENEENRMIEKGK